jgi:hypothetical protein
VGGRYTGGGRRDGSGRLGGVWGEEEDVEKVDDGSEQRVVLEGTRVFMLVTYFSTLKVQYFSGLKLIILVPSYIIES